MPSFSRTESISKYTSVIITDPSTTTKAALSNVWSSKTEKTGVRGSDRTDPRTNPRIQPLLSMKVERPKNLTFDKTKYEFSKPFCPPTKSDLGSDEE